jgi:hypothetical protein
MGKCKTGVLGFWFNAWEDTEWTRFLAIKYEKPRVYP